MEITKSTEVDRSELNSLYINAFGENEGLVIAKLVMDLFEDETAIPILSLAAIKEKKIIGHILFTKVEISGSSKPVTASILAPLAVFTNVQKKGIGGQLIQEGLDRLKQEGVELVFVLGHPDYYPRSGFVPAGTFGYEAPYPIAEKNAGAWMVKELVGGVIGRISGKIQCSKVLDRPEHWCE